MKSSDYFRLDSSIVKLGRTLNLWIMVGRWANTIGSIISLPYNDAAVRQFKKGRHLVGSIGNIQEMSNGQYCISARSATEIDTFT